METPDVHFTEFCGTPADGCRHGGKDHVGTQSVVVIFSMMFMSHICYAYAQLSYIGGMSICFSVLLSLAGIVLFSRYLALKNTVTLEYILGSQGIYT